MQNFVPRSHVGIFRNERIRSTPLHHKLTFSCVLYYLGHSGPFGCLTKLGAKRAELVQKFVPRSRVGIFRNERTQSTPLDPKLTFCYVLHYLGAFGTVWLPYETRCKTAELPQKYPKQTFWCVLYYLCAFVTIWLAYETRCKTGRSSAKVCATKSCQNFP